MFRELFLITLIFIWASGETFSIEDRKVHRLIGGHLRIYHEDPHDTELLTAAASGAKYKNNNNNNNNNKKNSEDEDRKTLSQQVADGKYGLIQKELFGKPLKRPGVISYDSNSEVPNDNIHNLGGLNNDDIWLAENHLLVLKGGKYPQHDKNENYAPIWPSIDDYKAPLRQVKIPSHPKVPPPFPVQLTDDGPLQILGTNSSRTINSTFDENAYFIPPPSAPASPEYYENRHKTNFTTGQTPFPIPGYPPGEYNPGAPFPPFLPLNGTLPPFFASLPPGAAILPPPNNLTDLYDEDDPSIYYPPPYSFYYPKDNSSAVPPGPLVPGIILPPPPNFFAPLEDNNEKAKTTTTTTTTITTTKKPRIHYYIPEKVTTTTTTTTRKPRIHYYTPEKITTTTTPLPQIYPTTTPVPPTIYNKKPVLHKHVTTPVPVPVVSVKTHTRKPPLVTILKPVKNYGPPQKTRGRTVVTSTQIPLRAYYSTSDIETNSITPEPPIFQVKSTHRPKTQSQYYYYEEPKEIVNSYEAPPPRPPPSPPRKYYRPSGSGSRYPDPDPLPPKYVYVTSRPYKNPKFVQQTAKPSDTFSIHIARLQKQIDQYYTTPRAIYRQSPKPVYQFSYQASNYQPHQYQDNEKFRPIPKYSVQIQPAIEIIPTQAPSQKPEPQPEPEPQPQSKYHNTRAPINYESENINKVTPRPISQYSFEATPNPIYQGYYTKRDENYFDDNTKQYFTTFGKKIPSTTPIIPTRRKPIQYRQQQQQQQQQQQNPQSLHGDTLINYLPQRPPINPQAEIINNQQINYPQVKYQPQKQQSEIIKSIPIETQDEKSSYISYELPGDDGAHFYFLTPQLAQSRDQGVGYYYSQPIRRNIQ